MSDSFNEQAVIDQLYTSHLFQGMKRTDVQSILAQMHRKHWPRHAQVMPATMTKTNFYILLTGRVRVEAEHPESGRAITLFLLGPGEGHNLITLLDGKPHQVIAETLDEVQALCAPITSWQTWMRTYPALHQAAMRCAGMRLRELADLVEDLALHDTSARLAHLLLRHLGSLYTNRWHLWLTGLFAIKAATRSHAHCMARGGNAECGQPRQPRQGGSPMAQLPRCATCEW